MLANHARPEPASCKLIGTVIDATSGERLPGATLVLTGDNFDDEQVLITDENGRFAYGEEARGRDQLTIYYDDVETKRRVTACGELNIALWLRPPR